jgi:hypothetical protein
MKEKKQKSRLSNVTDFIGVSGLIICEDFIHGKDGSITCIRLCDQFATNRELSKESPAAPKVNAIIELWLKPEVAIEDLNAAKLNFELSIVNPSGAEIPLDTFEVRLDEEDKWVTQRTIIPLTNHLGFSSLGNYYFVLKGRLNNDQFLEIGRRLIRVISAPQIREA